MNEQHALRYKKKNPGERARLLLAGLERGRKEEEEKEKKTPCLQ